MEWIKLERESLQNILDSYQSSRNLKLEDFVRKEIQFPPSIKSYIDQALYVGTMSTLIWVNRDGILKDMDPIQSISIMKMDVGSFNSKIIRKIPYSK